MKREIPFSKLLFILVVVLGATAASYGQNAQITGRVTDQSNAVVPGAQVNVINQQTGLTRDAVTNEDGYFTILFLPPGRYNVNVKKDGFKNLIRSDVTLNVDQQARLDFLLEAGAINEQVTITTDAPLLNTETASVGQVIDNKTVETLPLNGRNYTQLVGLTPGAVPNPGSRASDSVQLNGQRITQTNYRIDGMENNNPIVGLQGSSQAVRPSVDAIQEFRVEGSNVSAEFGNSSGGVVNVAIKSGTNNLHGTAFEFFRNDALDANSFFANRSGLKKSPFRFNQFGGTLGGPIVKNKLFLFGSYQGTITRSGRTVVTTVPTAQMKQGIFPFPVYDPLTFNPLTFTRSAFLNNTIPQERWDAVGAKLLALFPNPNLPGLTNNYAGQIRSSVDNHQVDIRSDYVMGDKDTLFARYSNTNDKNNQGSLFAGPGYGGSALIADQASNTPSSVWSLAGGYNHVFSAAWANELRIGFTKSKLDQQTTTDGSLYSQFGFKGVPNSGEIDGLPTILTSGYSLLGDRLFAPNPFEGSITYISDNVSWTHGTHSIRLGGDYRWQTQLVDQSLPGTGISRGLYVFAGLYSSQVVGTIGSPIADLLLGQTYYTRISAGAKNDLRNFNYGFYINDSWKVTPKLTLNLGLRYELQSPSWEVNQQSANFDLNPGSSTYGKLVTAKKGSILDRSFVNFDKNNIAPRVGIAYQLNDKTVARAAFGIFHGKLGAYDTAPGNPPFSIDVSTAQTFPTCFVVSCAPLSTGLPAGFVSAANVVNPQVNSVPADRPVLETYQWNLSVQRELPGNFSFTASYVGSGTINLIGDVNRNQPLPGTTAIPFPGFGAIVERSPFAHATYHSLQAKAERRFTNGVSLLSSWTWSHAIDGIPTNEDFTTTLGTQSSYNYSLEKASSNIDLQHRWVTSVIYDLPIGRKDKFLGGSSVARAILGGWQLGGIFVAQTGLPFTPTVSRTVQTGNTLRPNLVRDPNLSGSQRTIDRWFDTTAFTVPAVGSIGTAGRNILRGPGYTNLDLLVSRSFSVTETMRLDFRAEMFNALNRAHFGIPNAVVDLPTAGRITTLQAPPRQIQFGLKFVF